MKILAEEVKRQHLTCFPYAGISLIRFNGSHIRGLSPFRALRQDSEPV